MICSVVVLYYEVKNWTLYLRTLFHFHRTRDDPPACPNASGHPVAVEVVVSPNQRNAKPRGCSSAPRSHLWTAKV